MGSAKAGRREPEARGQLSPAADADEVAALVDPGAQRVLPRLAEVQRRHLGIPVRCDEDVDVRKRPCRDLLRRDVLEGHMPLLVEEPAEPAR
jgi:hypothetical protein